MQSLEAEVGRWLEKRPYRVFTKLDTERREKTWHVEVLEQPPAHLSLIIGDCLHNLRAALDNLVYELALAHHGGRVPSNVEGKSAFPIFRNSTEFARKRKDMIGGIAPGAQTIIEALQPYSGPDSYETDPLWTIRQLSNADKHRLPHLTLLVPRRPPRLAFEGRRKPWMSGQVISGPIENSAVVVRLNYTGYGEPEVDVNLHDTFSVGFRDRLPTRTPTMLPVSDILEDLRQYIIDPVVVSLRPFLT